MRPWQIENRPLSSSERNKKYGYVPKELAERKEKLARKKKHKPTAAWPFPKPNGAV